jgi:sigma-B regulation protein RsbU (phosphoserine phosphatase)
MFSDPAQLPADRLALLYRLTQTFNSSLDLDEVLSRVIDEVIAATRAERGFVMLREAGGSLGFRTARGMEHETIDHPEFQISRSIVERVAHSGEPMLADDVQSDDRFSMGQSVVSLNLRSIVCVPLKTKDTVSGVVYVDNRLQSGIFGPADLELLSAIASSAAVAVENARLYELAVEKGRLERELSVARRVQSSFLPRHTPLIPGWEFSALWRPARQVSGDFYDYVRTENGHIGILIGDVSGKGVPAALTMARLLAEFRVRAMRGQKGGLWQREIVQCLDETASWIEGDVIRAQEQR